VRVSEKKKTKIYQTASFFFFRDGWMDGYMDGWMDSATQTSFSSASTPTSSLHAALYFGKGVEIWQEVPAIGKSICRK
jgi:hypothetical protein